MPEAVCFPSCPVQLNLKSGEVLQSGAELVLASSSSVSASRKLSRLGDQPRFSKAFLRYSTPYAHLLRRNAGTTLLAHECRGAQAEQPSMLEGQGCQERKRDDCPLQTRRNHGTVSHVTALVMTPRR
jgi:hypothetical protein